MNRSFELKEQRLRLVQDQRALLNKQSRTAEDRKAILDIDKQLDQLDQDILVAEKSEEREQRLSQSSGPRAFQMENGNGGSNENAGSALSFRSGGEIWTDKKGNEVRVYSAGESLAKHAVCRSADLGVRDLRIGAVMRAMLTEPRSDAERRALAEGTGSTGGYAVPAYLSAQLIDRLRKKATIFRAGARTVPLESNDVSIARLKTGVTTTWHTENDAIADVDATFDRVQFKTKTCLALVRASRELVEDSANIETALETELTNALSLELDRVGYFGVAASGEPVGLANIVGVNSKALDNFATYDDILDAWYECAKDDAPDPTAAVMAPRTEFYLAKLKDTTDQPLQRPPKLENLPFLGTNQIPINEGVGADRSRIFVGHFPSMMVGIRTDIRLEVLRERFSDNFQLGFLAHFRADIQVEHPEAFCQTTGVK